MALAISERVSELKVDTYHGVPVLRLHVDDPIPSPRAPQWLAVQVNPDLARYLLGFNHANNRTKKPGAIAKYRADMEAGYWAFTPEPIIFSSSGILEDGQNRLHAAAEAGATVWMVMTFGWPEGIIQQINRGMSRTNADALKVDGKTNETVSAAAIGIVEKYDLTVLTPLRWTGRTLSASQCLSRYEQDPERWDAAATMGNRAYVSTRGLGPAIWAAAYYLISREHGPQEASSFYEEFMAETGEPGSATRKLKSHYLRRKAKDTASGDVREPIENIVRAFNAYIVGRSVSFVRTSGAFELAPIRRKK